MLIFGPRQDIDAQDKMDKIRFELGASLWYRVAEGGVG
jgi:hypothetical protein